MEVIFVFLGLLGLAAPVMAIVALIKSAKADRLERNLHVLREEFTRLRDRVAAIEKPQPEAPVASAPSPQVARPPEPALAPLPMPPPPVAPPLPPKTFEPAPLPSPVSAQLRAEASKITGPVPILPTQVPEATPIPPVVKVSPAPVPLPSVHTAPAAQARPTTTPEAAPKQPTKPVSLPPVPKAARRSLEDFLGTQLFLKVGVAILVIGVVFAMGLVFQMVGPLGKVLMGYAGGAALLGTGLAFERKDTFRSFGRALIAGSWGILYFVTFAAGFVDGARIFSSKLGAVIALLVAGGAAVAFSLRYRHEWTTISAFLLIHLSLGIAACHLMNTQNLVATLIVALAIAVLVWRTGWFRLLGLGVPATWLCLALWVVAREAHTPWLLAAILATTLAFQWSILVGEATEADFSWIGLAQIANFLVPFGLCLREALPHGQAWLWALGFGLAGIAFAFAHGRQRRHSLFLLTATEALAALAFVTPLRLGLHHELTPIMRLLGLEFLFAAGVFLKERYFRILATVGFAITLIEALALRTAVPGPGRTWLFTLGAALLLLNAGLLRTRWRDICERELPGLAWGFSLAGTLCLTVISGLDLPLRWLSSSYALMALAWTLVALISGYKDVLVEALALGVISCGAALVLSTSTALAQQRALPLGVSCGLLIAVYVSSRLWRLPRLRADGVETMQWLFSLTALITAVIFTFRTLPAPWPPPVLVAGGLALLFAGLRLEWRELLVEGIALGPVALLAALPHLEFSGTSRIQPLKRASMLGLLAVGALGKEALLRRMGDSWPWTWTSRNRFVSTFGIAGAALAAILVLTEAPDPAMGAAFMALGLIWILWARWSPSALRTYLSAAFVTLGFITLATHGWWVKGFLGPFPMRLAAVGSALLVAFTVQDLYQRTARSVSALAELFAPGTLKTFATLSLLACSVTLGLLVKMEALGHDKNLLVALAWALAGVLYLERARALGDRAWRIQGHVWMGVALLHFLAVNLVQPGDIGGLSLRMATGLPFLGLLLYVFWFPVADETEHPESQNLRWSYFYALQLTLALLVLYEVHRAWVLPLWALQALVSLGWGLRGSRVHWLRSALILAVASLVRGIGTNLYFRDELRDFRLNWVTVPLATSLILAGYLALNRRREEAGPEGFGSFWEGLNRHPWFIAQAVLLFAFIWVEASGTALTVWLSAYGLGMVSLGFLLKERMARLTGLGMLSACILKLFLYDLRGLSGLPRVLSFLMLGGVLIAVSYTYTRFKERLEKLL